MDESLQESVWARGWKDTQRGLHNLWFWLFEVGATAVLGVIAQSAWVALAPIAGIVLLWAGVTTAAPIRQRNEARAALFSALEQRSLPVAKLLLRRAAEFGLTLRTNQMKTEAEITEFYGGTIALLAELRGDWAGAECRRFIYEHADPVANADNIIPGVSSLLKRHADSLVEQDILPTFENRKWRDKYLIKS